MPYSSPLRGSVYKFRHEAASANGSALMARTSRIELNRQKLDSLLVHIADGLHAEAEAILANANPPDAPPYGQGLVKAGGTAAFVGTKKVAGDGSKPRSLRATKTEAVAIVGFGFPGRFQETGTVNHPAQPFLGPAMTAHIGSASFGAGLREHFPRKGEE